MSRSNSDSRAEPKPLITRSRGSRLRTSKVAGRRSRWRRPASLKACRAWPSSRTMCCTAALSLTTIPRSARVPPVSSSATSKARSSQRPVRMISGTCSRGRRLRASYTDGSGSAPAWYRVSTAWCAVSRCSAIKRSRTPPLLIWRSRRQPSITVSLSAAGGAAGGCCSGASGSAPQTRHIKSPSAMA